MDISLYSLNITLFCIFSSILTIIDGAQSSLSLENTLIWGPGLDASITLPARFFFIQAVNTQGENITESIGAKVFDVDVSKSDGARARIWTQLLDRGDGSYVVRYKLYDNFNDLIIHVRYGGKHVANSPYSLEGPVHHEKCNCPVPVGKWLKRASCPKSYTQIKLDLSLFKDIDMLKVEKEMVSRFNRPGSQSLCHYVIKNNKIYRKTYGEHVGFKMFMDAILLSITRKVKLPDFEFFSNLGDWPLEDRKLNENPLPIFSWCGSDETRDIVMPTYDVTESTLETMGRVTLDLLSVQAHGAGAWEDKSNLAFWRGRDSSRERLELVKLARRFPDIFNASLTNMFFFKHSPEMGELVKPVSFFDFFKYKYQINMDGTVAAYRFPYLLAGNSVVLKQDSNYYEHFYRQLKPYKHYIPFKRDISDVIEQVQWAQEHQEEAKQIALNGQNFVREHLMADEIYCYHVILFREYAKRLVSKVTVREGMEQVEQPKDQESKCSCPKPMEHDEL